MNEEEINSFKDSLSNAANLFNNQKWYEAHDAFEDIWNNIVGDERQIIQGILQVSVSQFHLCKGNINGATGQPAAGPRGLAAGRPHRPLQTPSP